MNNRKVALVTGASSGIGIAFAREYAKKGYSLLLVARTKDKLETLANQLKAEFKIETFIFVSDLSKEYAAKDIFAYTAAQGINVDVLVNNAGFAKNGLFSDLTIEQQHNQLMVNSVAVMDLSYLFIEGMVQRGAGTIINVASTTAFYPIPLLAVYAASKAFTLSFTEALHVEYQDKGVRVIAVSPGTTDTGFFDNGGGVSYGKMRQPQDVVNSAIKGLERNKVSVIDGSNNLFNSLVLPRILTRNRLVNFVGNIMNKQLNGRN